MNWFRLYDETIDDPKILRLTENNRWFYIAILCLSNRQPERGLLPPLDDIAIHLRLSVTETEEVVDRLVEAGLIDKSRRGKTFSVHGWSKRQRKSDDVAARVGEWRRNKPVTLQDGYKQRYGNDTRVCAQAHSVSLSVSDSSEEGSPEGRTERELSPGPFIHATDTPLAQSVRDDAVRLMSKIDIHAEMQANELIRAYGAEVASHALKTTFAKIGARRGFWRLAQTIAADGLPPETTAKPKPDANGTVPYKSNAKIYGAIQGP